MRLQQRHPWACLWVTAFTMSLSLASAAKEGASASDDISVEKLGEVYPDCVELTVSKDGRHMAYGIVRDGRCAVVLDGKPGPWLENFGKGSLRFSPDFRRFAYGGQKDGRWHFFVDGQMGPAFDILEQSVRFSSRGNRLAYGIGAR